jgi:hypothetical protein
MRLINYVNDRTGQALQGLPSDQANFLAFTARRSTPDVQVGDLLTLPSGQQSLVIAVDQTALGLPRPSLRHLEVCIAAVTGRVTVSRRSDAIDQWGRSTADTAAEVLTNAPTCMGTPQLVQLDPAPAGGSQVIQRYRLTVQSSVDLRPADTVIYSVNGATLELVATDAWPLAGNLWQISCLA